MSVFVCPLHIIFILTTIYIYIDYSIYIAYSIQDKFLSH